MGGTIIRIKDFNETLEWCGHSADVANVFNLQEIYLVGEGKGDRHDGTITVDPDKRQIIIDTDYFTMERPALKFWRAIGFDVVFHTSAPTTIKEDLE